MCAAGVEEGFQHKIHESYKIVPRDTIQGSGVMSKSDPDEVETSSYGVDVTPLQPIGRGRYKRVNTDPLEQGELVR